MSLIPSPRVASARVPLRGYTHRFTDHMEQFQKSYLQAIAAAAGCNVGSWGFDDGIDVELAHQAASHLGDHVARLEIQMKATHQQASVNDEFVSARMSKDRWDYYSTADATLNKIVVIMVLPKNQAHWVFARDKALSLHHCAYWVNLAGLPEATAMMPTVKAPKSQVFNDVALCDMMERIGQGGKP